MWWAACIQNECHRGDSVQGHATGWLFSISVAEFDSNLGVAKLEPIICFRLVILWSWLVLYSQVMSGTGDALVPESERIASNVNELEVDFDPSK